MDLLIIGIFALLGSLLTFFSGFGLGTILTPIFIIFFPIDVAITLTAIVHFLNNLFKFGMTYRSIDWQVAIKFSIPAVVFAFFGAWTLSHLTDSIILYEYSWANKVYQISLIKVIVAILMLVFVIIEIHPVLSKMSFDKNKIYFGGILSGYFGGLIGMQGALRTMFLMKSNLSKESFIATGVMIACFIDISRLSKYFSHLSVSFLKTNSLVLAIAVLAAFLGAYIGSRFIQKVTFVTIQRVVSTLLIVLAVLLALGVI